MLVPSISFGAWPCRRPGEHVAGPRSCRTRLARPSRLCSFYAVQAMGSVLHGEEHNVAVGSRFAAVGGVGRDVEQRAGLGLDGLAADLGHEGALQDVDPLLVGMRMRLGAGA